MAKRYKFKQNDKDTGHFFASSIATWMTGEDPEKIIKNMKTERFNFNLFFVPVPLEQDYEIDFYTPQVDGAVFLGSYER